MKILQYSIIILILIMSSSCRFFDPRESEEPNKPADWNTFQVTPQKTLENLIYAYNFRENVYNYTNIFSDQFVFHFDAQDVVDFNVPVLWNKSKEIDMLMNLYQSIGQQNSMLLSFEAISSQPDNIQVDRAWFFRHYSITLTYTVNSIPREFYGKMQIYMEKDSNGFWKIKDWYDYRISNQWTWGRLKNEFSL